MLSLCRQKRGLLLANCLLLLAMLFLTVLFHHSVNRQYSQTVAKRWENQEIPYHQISVFMEKNEEQTASFLSGVRNSIQASLQEAAYTDASVPGRLWMDAYMTEGEDAVSKISQTGQATVEHVPIMAVGGDFFLFHPVDLLFGSTFTEDDINGDRVVIDENLAWALYGAYDIAGKTVQIGEKQFVVAGVYRASDAKEDETARENACLYMSYDAFCSLYEGQGGISCYEAVIPNPVKDFALKAVKKAFGEDEDEQYDTAEKAVSFENRIYVANTQRFGVFRLYGKLFQLPKLVMRTNAVQFPAWENAVRMVEIRLSFLLWIRLFLLFLLILADRRQIWWGMKWIGRQIKKLPGESKKWVRYFWGKIASRR